MRLLALLLLIGCGSAPQPRHASLTLYGPVSESSISGSTGGQTWAGDLGEGCVGFLAPGQPGHVIHIPDNRVMVASARPGRGHVAMVVRSGSQVVCDGSSDQPRNPAVTLQGPGSFEVFVTALGQPAENPYTLYLEPHNPVVITVSDDD